MAKHLGDFDPGTNIFDWFTTVANGNSVGSALANGNVVVYRTTSNANFIDGVSLTVSYAGVAGQNQYNVNTAANATLYAAGGFFSVALNNGTVAGTSAAGYVLSTFTLRADSALKPATAGRTLVVDAGGCAAANVLNPTLFNANVTQWLGVPVIAFGAANGPVINGINAGNITTNLVANMTGSVNTVNQTVNANALNVANVNVTQWLGVTPQQLGAANGIVINGINGGNITQNIVGNMTGTVGNVNSTVNTNLLTWLGVAPNPLISGRVDVVVGAMNVGVIAAGTIAAAELTNIELAVWDKANGLETGQTMRAGVRYTAAASAGNLTGGNTTSVAIAGLGVGTLRITASTPDANGNTRTVTLS